MELPRMPQSAAAFSLLRCRSGSPVLADEHDLEAGRAPVLLHELRDALATSARTDFGQLLPIEDRRAHDSSYSGRGGSAHLEDARENTVEVVEILVRDHHFALVAVVLDDDLGAGPLGQAILEVAKDADFPGGVLPPRPAADLAFAPRTSASADERSAFRARTSRRALRSCSRRALRGERERALR